MRRWLQRILGIITACGLAAGCKQQMFLSKECFTEASATLPAQNLDTDFGIGNAPLMSPTKTPPTVDDPDRPPRHLTLREAIATALENGSVSDQQGGFLTGLVNDTLVSAAGGFTSTQNLNTQIDRVKAIALYPAIAGANLEASLSRFDPQWVTAMNWSTTDNIQQGLASFTNGNTGQFSTSIIKGLSTGGVASMTFNNNYRQLNGNVPNAISPLYESRVDIGFEQPLWRDYGTDINQVLARFPSFNGTSAAAAAAAYNSRQNSGNNLGVGTEGILIARIRVEQQRAEFERRVHNLLIGVEAAYWKLYQAYGRLVTFEYMEKLAHRAWHINNAKFVAGTIGPKDFHPFRAQYEEFQGERLQALGNVLEAERNLRGFMGLPGEDGFRLVPIDAPTLAPYQPNWEASVQMALMQKPELAIARDNLRAAQFALVSQKNFLKPDLRFSARYSPVGFGTRLDGNGSLTDGAGIPRSDNALRSLAGGDFNDWNLGFTLSMPLGFRLEHAAVRAARLQLAQSYYLLSDTENKLVRSMQKDYGKISEWYSLIQKRDQERESYAKSVSALAKEVDVGKITSYVLLDLQRRLATAQVKEFEAIAEYNIALAAFEFKKGNILKHNNVMIAEGPLPECAEVRAIDHEKERAKAIILRERPRSIQMPSIFTTQSHGTLGPVDLPPDVSHLVPSTYSSIVMPVGATQNVVTPATNVAGPSPVEPVNSLPVFRSVPKGPAAGSSLSIQPANDTGPPVIDRVEPASTPVLMTPLRVTPPK